MRRSYGTGSLTELRPGVWRLRVWLGPDPVTGRPRQASRTVQVPKRGAKTAAQAELRRFVEEVRGKKPGAKATVETLMADYLRHVKRIGRAQSTVDLYASHSRKWIVPALGKTSLEHLSARDLDDFYSSLEGKLSQATIGVVHAVVSGALGQAERWGWVQTNVAKRASPPKGTRQPEEPPTPDEVRRLIEQAESEKDHELAVAVALTAVLGCRRGELCGLRWEDVDLDAGTARIDRQWIPGEGGDREGPPKRGQRRVVALGAFGVAALQRYQAVQAARWPGWAPSGWLVSLDGGETHYRPRNVSDQVRRLGERCKPPVDVHPHALRHWAATYLVGAGMDLRTAAGRFGHRPSEMVDTYAAFLPAMDQRAAELLGAALMPPAREKPPPPTPERG